MIICLFSLSSLSAAQLIHLAFLSTNFHSLVYDGLLMKPFKQTIQIQTTNIKFCLCHCYFTISCDFCAQSSLICPCLLCLLIPRVIYIVIGATVNHLHTVPHVFKLTSVGLWGCVLSLSVVSGRLLSPAGLSYIACDEPPMILGHGPGRLQCANRVHLASQLTPPIHLDFPTYTLNVFATINLHLHPKLERRNKRKQSGPKLCRLQMVSWYSC